MSVLSTSDTRVASLPFYSVGDMTYIPSRIDDDLLHKETVEVVEELWPSHKLYYMLPDAMDSSPRNLIILSDDLNDHSTDFRQSLIWKSESNIVPAIRLREGVVVSVTGSLYRALISIGWREAVYGNLAYFINRWESVGEGSIIDSCYLTPYVTAEQTELAGTELETVRSTQLSRFIRPLENNDTGYGLDLSLAVKFQLECWLGPHQVTVVNSVADHFGHQQLCSSIDGEHSTQAADAPMPGVYLGLCS